MIGPYWLFSSSMSSRAASVTPTRAGSEEAKCFLAVADQYVLGLLIMVEHHLVCFAANTRLLVAAEGRMRRIRVIAVGPDASRFDTPSKAIGGIHIARPHSGAQSVQR